MSPCRVEGCDRERREGHLLCSRCWYLVPADVRAEVWRSYKMLMDCETGEQKRGNVTEISRRYANAARHATRLAEEALSKRAGATQGVKKP